MKTSKQEGYKFKSYEGHKTAVFTDTTTGYDELFFAHKHMCSWGFIYNNTEWEFVAIVGGLEQWNAK